MDRLEKVRGLFKKYDLTSSEFFKSPQGWVIITLPGVEKIQAKEDIKVEFEAEVLQPDFAVIKAIATKGDRTIETYGSAKKGGFKDGTTMSWYIAEIAEKRALARAILKMENLYSEGVYSESEADDFQDERKDITSDVINRGNNAILRGEKTAEEVIEACELSYIIPETTKYAWRALKVQS